MTQSLITLSACFSAICLAYDSTKATASSDLYVPLPYLYSAALLSSSSTNS